MARLSLPDQPTPEQAEVIAEAIAGKRGKVPGPMIGWLPNPELARRAQRLGELLRFDTDLDPALTEIAILVCARHWTSHYEWTAHKRLALAAGVDPQTVADIAARKPTPFMRDDREGLVLGLSRKLLTDGRLIRADYDRGVAGLGQKGMVDLVGILGYYCLVSLTLNAFELGLPESHAPELEQPE